MDYLNRRQLFGAALAAGSLAAWRPAHSSAQVPSLPPGTHTPHDTAYWDAVAAQFDVSNAVIQLENGNFGTMARPVVAAYGRYTAMVNEQGSYYARRSYAADFARIRARTASALGVGVDEIGFTRGATEALMSLIGGYQRLRAGDALLCADLDYDSTLAAFEQLRSRRGVQLIQLALPEPATHQGLIDAYAAALAAHPNIRLVLLTHVSHRTGLVLPVAQIVELARAHGADVIVDSAHAWGQLDFRLPDLQADFVALTAQKWIGAPLGVGLFYIRRGRAQDIAIALGDAAEATDPVDRRVHTGTANYAAFLALADALDFHERIGARAKETRLRHLRDRWAEQLRGHDGIEVLTPADPRLTCGITSFRLRGLTTPRDNATVAAQLLQRFNIFTVERSGVARGACVRVTPAIFTPEAYIDRLVTALKSLGPALAAHV